VGDGDPPRPRTAGPPPRSSSRERLLGIAFSLAGAVDYKGGYRAHSQTVAELAHGIGEQLGVGGDALPPHHRRAAARRRQAADPRPHPAQARRSTRPSTRRSSNTRCSATSTLIALGLPDEAKWVLHHHERGDGGGYPSGLHGDQIPLGSRILLAADAWECMTADRPYRPACHLPRGRGDARLHRTQFDVDVVEALLNGGHAAGRGRPSR
jgi:hypothetical protein